MMRLMECEIGSDVYEISVKRVRGLFTTNSTFLHSDQDEKEQPSWTCPAPKLSNILALLIKNWITMKRNPVLLIFIFFLPGIFMVLTCISIGIDPVDLPVGVVNYETNCTGVNLNVSKISL